MALLVREPHRCTLTVACISGILILKWFGDALGIRKSGQTRRVNRSRQATQRFGIGEGSMVTAEAREDGILNSPCRHRSCRKVQPRAQNRVSSFQQRQPAGITAGQVKRLRNLAAIRIRFSIENSNKWTDCFWVPMYSSL